MRDIIIRREKEMLQCLKHLFYVLSEEEAEDRPSEVNIRNYKTAIRNLEVSLGWV
jgi:hypothetical protein